MTVSIDEHASRYFVPTGGNIQFYLLFLNAEALVWTSWGSTKKTPGENTHRSSTFLKLQRDSPRISFLLFKNSKIRKQRSQLSEILSEKPFRNRARHKLI